MVTKKYLTVALIIVAAGVGCEKAVTLAGKRNDLGTRRKSIGGCVTHQTRAGKNGSNMSGRHTGLQYFPAGFKGRCAG
jgi:hypothetical protein